MTISLMRSTLLLACLAASGCSLVKGGPLISDRVWLLSQNAATAGQDYIPLACPQTDEKAVTFTQPNIEKCVNSMLLLIDVKWIAFRDELLTSSSNANLAADVGLLGLGGAGSFVSGTATQILHAASAGVTGLRSSINQDLLYSNTITAILFQMDADRTAQRKVIEGKLAGYTDIYDAANDLFIYARAGSWNNALLSIQKSAAGSAGNTPGGSNIAKKAPTP